MKRFRSLFFGLVLTQLCFAQSQVDSVHTRLFLVGDAGDFLPGTSVQPVVDWLKKNVNWNDEKNVIIYLGDNIYPLGLPMEGEPGYSHYKDVIDYQINLVKGKKSRAYFVPGNHDWKNGKLGGWQRVINQHNYINSIGDGNIQSLPVGGCPGPEAVDISEKVVVVFVDSQWFLYVHDKPGPGSDCESRTVDEFATQLENIIAEHPNQLLIIAMHHPMYTYGPHGGDYTWKEHLFPLTAASKNLWIPLPVIGSIYPITRGVFGNLQDVRHPLYQIMVKTIEDVIKKHPNAMQVAGHDHSVQLIMKDSIPYIISGSAINTGRVGKGGTRGKLLFADVVDNGLAMLEIRKSGKTEVKFYTTKSAGLDHPIFAHELKKIDTLPTKISKDSIPILPDSITVIANPKLKGSFLRNLFMGKNYRTEWTTPVRVPVLDLGKEQGGLAPQKQGGGKQTRSLRLEDRNGREWALRSVEKYPDAAIPPDLRQTFVRNLVEDGISASYPYSALSIAPMAHAAGVPVLRRKLVYIPDDPRLGRFRDNFKNTLATLEEREPLGINKTYNTQELVLRLAKDNDDHVDQLQVLRARLLDNFYMDFDRHEDQWRWGTRDTGKGKIYYAIPRDQDQAFFTNEGIFPWLARKPWLVPEIQGFREEINNVTTFNKPARNFDRFFLNQLDAKDWSKQIDTFLMRMTDDVINESMMMQPKEVRNQHAREIMQKLKKRRAFFRDDMMDYYEFISKEVNIVGTNQRELFNIDKKEDGKIHVTINKIDKQNVISSKIYDRVFEPDVTKEIHLYGLEDADSFVIRGGKSPIKVRIIGGPGRDHFANVGSGGTVNVYDVNFEENKFSGSDAGIVNKLSGDPQVNLYNRLFYKYSYFIPSFSVAFNADDGLFLGLRGEMISQGFRKEPYAMRQYLNVNHALRTRSYRFRYEADFIKPFGNSDLLVRADVRAPVNVTNFFGYGNHSVYDRTKPGEEQYYRARYNIANASVLVKKQLQSWMRANIGPTFQYFHVEEHENRGRFITDIPANGLDATTLYNRKTYLGAEALLDINSRNNQVLPTRGFQLDAGLRSLFGLNQATNNLLQFHWDMNVIASFVPNARWVFAARFGYAANFGKFELPQAQYLSGPENLRGYRRNRFAGKSVLFQNSEIRIRMADFTTYLFPGAVGLLAFHDIGRVWMPNEKSHKWHNGYGGGIWIAPVKRLVISGILARSPEEKVMPYLKFGFQF